MTAQEILCECAEILAVGYLRAQQSSLSPSIPLAGVAPQSDESNSTVNASDSLARSSSNA